MGDDIPGIENDPVGFTHAESGFDTVAPLAQFFFDMIGNGTHMTVGSAGADDKIIAKVYELTHIKNNDILCLLI